MNETAAAALLGFIQGLTEFLPVSSSGHLVIFQRVLPVVGDHVAFDLVLHLGTLVPVLWVFRATIAEVFRDLLGGSLPWAQRPGNRLLFALIVGSVPTALIGLAFEDLFEALFSNPLSVAIAFLVTGTVLFSTRFVAQGRLVASNSGWWRALLIGVVQGLAITPGISRSGSTIAAGMFLGLDRQYAARFSFLLSVPAIGGAFLLKVGDLRLEQQPLAPLVVGFLVSATTGYLALRLLLRVVRTGDFSRFSWYLWVMAGVGFWLALG